MNDSVTDVFDNKIFVKPHKSLLDVVTDGDKKIPRTKPVIINSIFPSHSFQDDGYQVEDYSSSQVRIQEFNA